MLGPREEVALEGVCEDAEHGRGLVLVLMALLSLLSGVRGGRAVFGFGLPQGGGAVEPLGVLQLDVGAEGGRRLQETPVVEEAEDSAALLSEGIQDEAVFCGRGEITMTKS